MKIDLYDFKDYKAYLLTALKSRQLRDKGQKSKLAIAIGCQPAYLSQVLNGPKDLSLEQAQAASDFLGHSTNEAAFFLRLVMYARAGTQALKKIFEGEVQSIKEQRKDLRNRIQPGRELTSVEQAKHYSHWYYAAIQTLVDIDRLRTPVDIAQALGLPVVVVSEALDFLESIGLVKKVKDKYVAGETSVYLDKHSPFIQKHHVNWALRALHALDQKNEMNFHYSAAITFSEKDAEKVRSVLMDAVAQIRQLVQASNPEEVCYAYTVNFFNLLNSPQITRKDNT